jgi:hypothetical protein
LRARAALALLLRRHLASSDRGAAFDHALKLGDAAAAALARIPDDAKLRRADDRALAGLDKAAADPFAARLAHLVAHYRDGGALDPDRAAPAELLARCIARAAAG